VLINFQDYFSNIGLVSSMPPALMVEVRKLKDLVSRKFRWQHLDEADEHGVVFNKATGKFEAAFEDDDEAPVIVMDDE
jgi:hypothetical protein